MRDFLGECNNLGVPEEDFRQVWCVRCVQPDCERSHSKFEARVATWEERLFTSVPRMPTTDPRYKPLASQAFEQGESWKPPTVQVQVPIGWEGSSRTEPAPDPSVLPSAFVSARVPHQSGKVLGGQQVVKPGAHIRLGSPKEPGSPTVPENGKV